MTDYILLKKSQISLFKDTPFFYKTANKEYSLYKKKGDYLDDNRLNSGNHPDLYILDSDREKATVELTKALNMDLAKKVSEGKLKEVRQALTNIVNEALTPGQEKSMNSLPETIEILMGRYSKDHTAMALLTQLGSNSSVLIEHTVNVTALILQFCFFHRLSEADTQHLSMAALLHDIGCSKIEKELVETPKRLTDKQFETYVTHPELGHETIIENSNFATAIPTVVLEHHERLDGSGYPKGLNRISSYGQLIGLVDSYESLTYRSKLFRKKTKPYDSLNIIKSEIYEKKFAKGIFKRFTACLTK